MHMIREVLEVGRYKYKVYDTRGHLILVTENASIAQIYYERGEAEELQRNKYAELRRNAESGGSSDSNSV
tara:strand:+ start:232 stop:441 length:210 start_codon:yes stop_codon:yes gene_type:complete